MDFWIYMSSPNSNVYLILVDGSQGGWSLFWPRDILVNHRPKQQMTFLLLLDCVAHLTFLTNSCEPLGSIWTQPLHRTRFWPAFFIFFYVIPVSSASLMTDIFQVFLGLPTFLSPWWVLSSACLATFCTWFWQGMSHPSSTFAFSILGYVYLHSSLPLVDRNLDPHSIIFNWSCSKQSLDDIYRNIYIYIVFIIKNALSMSPILF